jgi:hypothetical protein
VVGGSLAALALALPLGSASGHTTVLQNGLVFDTASTGPTTVQYSGQVFGAKDCRVGRAVDISVGGAFFTTVKTDGSGNFSATGPKPTPGAEATAVARKLVKKTKKHQHKCAAKAETKKVQQ